MRKLALMFGLAICLAIGLSLAEAYADETAWNGGHCECGTEWELVNVEHLRNSGDLYYYDCNNCGKVIRTHSNFRK